MIQEAPDSMEEPQNCLSSAAEHRLVVVGHLSSGDRLDKALAQAVPEFSRSYLQGLIAQGYVGLHGGSALTKPSRRVSAGDVLDLRIHVSDSALAYMPQQLPLEVLYEDAHILVINKPAGLVVHPAAGNWSSTLLNGLLYHYEKHGYKEALALPRAGIIHRLDKDTSGAMVVCKSHLAFTHLVQALGERRISRQYLAIAPACATTARKSSRRALSKGEPFPSKISSFANVGRDPHNRLRMAAFDVAAIADQAGTGRGSVASKSAQTDFVKIATRADFALVACRLHSGRTHQIRVHMADLGFALVGDTLYGGAAALGMTRQALHARRLSFSHPVSGEAVVWIAPFPSDFLNALLQIVSQAQLDQWLNTREELL